VPRKPPYLFSRFIQTEQTLISEVLDAGGARHAGSSFERQILDVFWDSEGPTFQHEDTVAMGCVGGKEMLRKYGAERPPAYNDYIKGAGIRTTGRVCTGKGLIKAVANVTSENISSESSWLGFLGTGHKYSFPLWLVHEARWAQMQVSHGRYRTWRFTMNNFCGEKRRGSPHWDYEPRDCSYKFRRFTDEYLRHTWRFAQAGRERR